MAPQNPPNQWVDYKHWNEQKCDKCPSPDHEFQDCPTRNPMMSECKRCGHGGHNKASCPFPAKDPAPLEEYIRYTKKYYEKALAHIAANSKKGKSSAGVSGDQSNNVGRSNYNTSRAHGGGQGGPRSYGRQPPIAGGSDPARRGGGSRNAGTVERGSAEDSDAVAFQQAEKKEKDKQRAREIEEARRAEQDRRILESREKGCPLAQRPPRGQYFPSAAPTSVCANFLELDVRPDKLFKYRIILGLVNERAPKKPALKKAMILSLMNKWANDLGPGANLQWVSDFSEIVVTNRKLFVMTDTPDVQKGKKMHMFGDGEKAESEAKFEANIHLQNLLTSPPPPAPGQNPYDSTVDISILNMVASHKIHENSAIAIVGKKFYHPAPLQDVPPEINGIRFGLDDGLYGRLGFFTSVRIGEDKLLLNVNTATSVFFSEVTVEDFLGKNSAQNIPRLIGVGVLIKGQKYGRVISDIKTLDFLTIERDKDDHSQEKLSAREKVQKHMEKRQRDDGREIDGNVKWYVNVGNHQYPDWYSSRDAMIMPFQPYREKYEGNGMVGPAERRPQHNKDHIRGTALSALGLLNGVWSPLGHGDIGITQIANRLILIKDSRILKTPTIKYDGWFNKTPAKKPFDQATKTWSNENAIYARVGEKYPTIHAIYVDFKCKTWTVKSENLEKSLKALANSLNTNGMNVDSEPNIAMTNSLERPEPTISYRKKVVEEMNRAFQSLRKAKPNSEIDLILVVLREKDANVYSHVKWWSDCVQGIATICVQQQKLTGMNFKTMGNLSLKFNVKLLGTNHILESKWGPKFTNTMIMGADVTHPGRGNPTPSLAAVVSTYGTDPLDNPHYLGSARLQIPRTEYIADLKGMVIERLNYWKKQNDEKLPDSILFYRDGVSETQFEMVQCVELPQIEEAFQEVAKDRKKSVKITLVVVGKRHHTRFFPVEEHVPITRPRGAPRTVWKYNKEAQIPGPDLRPNNPNLEAGLVVDSKIIAPKEFSFYLQSHHSGLGTAKSAHYFVIKNGMGLTAEELHIFTYDLCYLASRALMPVSVCPPARYADLLCDRLRHYMRPALERRVLPGDIDNEPSRNVALYEAENHIWATEHNAHGKGRKNPWAESLDHHMFYL